MKVLFSLLVILISLVSPRISSSNNLENIIVEGVKEIILHGVINEKLNNYQVIVIYRETSTIQRGRWDNSSILVCSKDLKDTLSINNDLLFKTLSSEKEDYEFIDINFDGYKDLKILYDMTANGLNNFYTILLFNQANNKFEYNEKISELISVNCTIDSINKEIYTYSQSFSGGRPSSFSETYKFQGNNLILVEEYGFYFIDSTDAETGTDLYRKFTKVRKDSSLVIIKDEVIKYNYGEE